MKITYAGSFDVPLDTIDECLMLDTSTHDDDEILQAFGEELVELNQKLNVTFTWLVSSVNNGTITIFSDDHDVIEEIIAEYITDETYAVIPLVVPDDFDAATI